MFPRNGPISVLLVDDSPELRRTLRTLLDLEGDFVILDEATNGQDGVRKALELNPDVVIINNSMPFMNGLEASYIIKQRAPHIRLVMVSAYDEVGYRWAASDAGISAYFVKPIRDMDIFCDTLRHVARGTETV